MLPLHLVLQFIIYLNLKDENLCQYTNILAPNAIPDLKKSARFHKQTKKLPVNIVDRFIPIVHYRDFLHIPGMEV